MRNNGTQNLALVGICAAAALLSGCADSAPGTGAPPTPSVSSGARATGTPPTDEQTAWAGDVCTATATVKTDVQALVAETTAGGGDLAARLKAQLATVTESAAELTDTVESVPEGSTDDPERAEVERATRDLTASLDALESSVEAVEGRTGTALASAVKAVAAAAGDSLVAVGSTVEAITTAAADSAGTIGQAFDTAPACGALTE